MRKLMAMAFVGVLGATSLRLSVGCADYANDCRRTGECCPDGTLACFISLSTGTGGGTPAACIPSENAQPVEDTCGLFVSSSLGVDGAAGTKSAPLKSLQQALDKANGRPVYACAEV